MKTLYLIFTISFVQLIAAQEKITRTVGHFSELKVFDGISVHLVKSNENEVIISGKNASNVITVNNSGKLKIRMATDEMLNGEKTIVEVHYTGMITILDVNEDALITASEPLEQISLEVRAQEGGKIQLGVVVQKLTAKSVTGGQIELSGSAKNQDVAVNTGGQYESDTLKTEQTTIDVNAGGRAYIQATEYVQAKVRAGGTIRIYGNPKVVDKQIFLGGRIIEQ